MQLSYSQDPAVGFAGMIADSPGGHRDVISRVLLTASLVAGLLAKRVAGGTDDKCQPVAAPAATVLNDPDTFKTNIGSTAGIQTFTGADFQGATGANRFWPPVNAVLVLNSHSDWDATTAVVTGLDELGRLQTEDLTIPNNGNATVVGLKFWTQIISLVIPAQTGTNGTATFGTGTRLGPLTATDMLGVAIYQAAREPEAFQIGESIALLRSGRVLVTVEEAVAVGQQAYVRLIATGNEVVGAFRASADGTPVTAPDAVPLIGGRFVSSTSGAGLAVLELDLAA